jgi:hypothetical protein
MDFLNSLVSLLSDPTVNQILIALGGAVLGWFLRHNNILLPAPKTPSTPDAPAPATPNPVLNELEKQLLAFLQQLLAQKQATTLAEVKQSLQAVLDKK